MTHPVQFHVEAPAHSQRLHVLIRLILLMALSALGWSSIYWLAWLALPALAALLISTKGYARYFAEDAPKIVRAVRWLAAAYAYLWLLTDRFPTGEWELQIETGGTPTPGSALLRILYSVPALLLLMVFSLAASLVWLFGAIAILILGRLPHVFADFLAFTLRYQLRILAYHLSLVDRYPSFAEEPAPNEVPHSGAV
jgi:hypothetical protein